ncbi:MAG TPA: hypothetical protein VGX23_20410 [Actinocrinis sp.]|nr:hypothetical protein [Actinocrinis sp.]
MDQNKGGPELQRADKSLDSPHRAAEAAPESPDLGVAGPLCIERPVAVFQGREQAWQT